LNPLTSGSELDVATTSDSQIGHKDPEAWDWSIVIGEG
jgi:hypothetical protein